LEIACILVGRGDKDYHHQRDRHQIFDPKRRKKRGKKEEKKEEDILFEAKAFVVSANFS